MLSCRYVSALFLLLALSGFSGCAGGMDSVSSGMSKALNTIKAGPAEDRGDNAYNNRDYVAALAAYQEAAEAGGQYGQFRLATMYFLGEGVKRDQKKYLDWMQKSAESGYPPANYLMGMNYISSDAAAAARYFEKAANQEHGSSMHMLGMMHARGIGVEQSSAEALRWFRMAKSQGVSVDEQLLTESGISDYMKTIAIPGPKKKIKTDDLGKTSNIKIAAPQGQKEDTDHKVPEKIQPSDSQNLRGAVDQTQLVREIQQQLSKLGYKPGVADGLYGSKTRNAIKAFQRKKGLVPDGLATEKLLEMLKGSVRKK